MNILEMRNVSKRFGGAYALKHVDFFVKKGEIHALLGENGAGKSTLMNILCGVIPADEGSIIFDGVQIITPSIKTTAEIGIAFVHQELNVINDLRVYENIFLCKEITNKLGKLNKNEMISATKDLFERLGVSINPVAMVADLKASEKQLLEISKALFFDAKLFILDEPTTALSNNEIEHLFTILNTLKEQGKSIIFISHKMPEIFSVSDRYTVLRNGEFIQAGNIADITPNEVTKLMVGDTYSEEEVYSSRELGDTILKLNSISGHGFKDVSFEIKKGEIVAFTGLTGSGASEIMQAMFGVTPIISGSIEINNKVIYSPTIHTMMRGKTAMLPSNRKENSVEPDLSILENIYLSEHTLSNKRQHINKRKEKLKYEELKSTLQIKSDDSDNPITSLSGGNQQKVFIARWLNINADILLLDNPTQGVDVGAKSEIYRLIIEFAEMGKTIIINTLEIPEIKKVSDRCVVFYEGSIIKIFDHNEINEHTVMLYSTNAVNAAEVKE